MTGPMKRGAFIVLEGCDRSGKSTQSRLLAEYLKSKDVPVQSMAFPARSSDIGKVINSYLTNAQNHTDEVIHLLFSANRWEFRNQMRTLLESGTTLIVDRYSYSGVAYSAAKGLDYDWCMAPEKGLLRPDMVFYLNTSIEVLTSRGNFGKERYEKNDFQCQVAEVFKRIYTKERDYWHEFDASLASDLLHQKLSKKALEVLAEVQSEPLQVLQ